MSAGAGPPVESEGPAAPPRRNGELSFEAPWESRAFGVAVLLHRRGLFAWDEFRRHLIDEIAAWERARPGGAHYCYYAHWLAALERVLAEKGVATGEELSRRKTALRARPHGHDHHHPERRR